MADKQSIPATPQVIAPSPTLSEQNETSSQYFPPVTRSTAKRTTSKSSVSEEKDQETDNRSRTRSRSPNPPDVRRHISGLTPAKPRQGSVVQKSEPLVSNGILKSAPNGTPNGLLSPASAWDKGTSYWRVISRSPSPLGLIPIHRHWRSFVHRHEVPRKALHVSIGFVTLWFYTLGLRTDQIHPWLLRALIPIATVDVIRHRWDAFNRAYIKLCGAMMRETEVHDRYNGVVFYLAGAWTALRFFPKDVGVMSVLLLSWCDTAASTFGRLYGRYTPRIRKGKSLAGSLAALITGILTAWIWYGFFVPRYFGFDEGFMFKGELKLPIDVRLVFGLSDEASTISGTWALVFMSIISGVIASLSELVDFYGLDDNISIPILSAVGLWGFLKFCT